MRTAVLLLIAVLLQASGNLSLSVVMKSWAASLARAPADWLQTLPGIAAEPLLWLGIACLIGFTVLFMVALSWTDLTLAMPVVSVEVIVNVAGARWLLGESVDGLRWLGTLLIAAGLVLVAGSAIKPAALDRATGAAGGGGA